MMHHLLRYHVTLVAVFCWSNKCQCVSTSTYVSMTFFAPHPHSFPPATLLQPLRQLCVFNRDSGFWLSLNRVIISPQQIFFLRRISWNGGTYGLCFLVSLERILRKGCNSICGLRGLRLIASCLVGRLYQKGSGKITGSSHDTSLLTKSMAVVQECASVCFLSADLLQWFHRQTAHSWLVMGFSPFAEEKEFPLFQQTSQLRKYHHPNLGCISVN